MTGALPDEDLDGPIAALRSQAAAAVPGTDDEVSSILTLAELLAERRGRRMAAGNLVGAAEDLGEWSAVLEDFLGRTSAGHPAYALAALGAAISGGERWSARAPADLDAAIARAQAGLASCTGEQPGPAAPAGGALGDQELAADLSWILGSLLWERLRAREAELDPADAVAVAAARADRDGAISALRPLLASPGPSDPARLEVADELGRLLHDRYDDWWPQAQDPDPADLDAAIELLTSVADAEPDPAALWYLALALSDRAILREAADDLDGMISRTLQLLEHPDMAGADTLEVQDLLASALEDRAGLSDACRLSNLDAVITRLEALLAATRPGAAGLRRLLAQLTLAYWLRMDGDASRYDDVDQMVGYATRAWRMADSGEPLPDLTGLYLVSGLQEQLRRPGQPYQTAEVNLGIEVLEQIEPKLAGSADLHLSVVVLLGLFLAARGQGTGSTADLAAAQPWLLQAADELPAGDPQFSEVTQLLATGMFTLASLGLSSSNMTRAIGLLTAACNNPGPESDRAAMTRGALGVALIMRAGIAAGGPDLDAGITQLTAAYEMAPVGHPYKIEVAVNLGSGLLERFMHTGDIRDRDAARFYLEVIGELSGPAAAAVRRIIPDLDVTITAMRGLLRLADGLTGEVAALDDAVRYLRSALAMVPAGRPHHDRLRSDLGLALTMRAAHCGGSAADYREATRELIEAARNLPPDNMMRHLGLMRVGASLIGAAHAERDLRGMREAIEFLTRLHAEVAGQPQVRVRLLATLGGACEALHRLSDDPADLDEAARWMEEACQEFGRQPGHPHHANGLMRLARIRRALQDRAGAREAGLAALRARGREVLLQTGTARGLSFARQAAADSAEVAAWCLAEEQAAAAVDAIELGRGLILHAATSSTDVPGLLAGTGHPDLAAEWQAQAGPGGEMPWDAGLSGTDFAGQLLAGDSPLAVPDALRARVLAALSGPAERRLLSPPAREQTAAALARTGADALVYLVASATSQPGCAILVPAGNLAVGARPHVQPLPDLRSSVARIADYATAYAAVLAVPPPPAGGLKDRQYQQWEAARQAALERWRRSLGKLCDWAWPAVMETLLQHVSHWGLDRLPRLVLVPVGRLSLVPWHAAAAPPDDSGRRRHACHEAVISYAASGRAVRRGQQAPRARLAGSSGRRRESDTGSAVRRARGGSDPGILLSRRPLSR